MSTRYTETVLFAYDTDNNRHLVATEYFYSGACYYSKRIEVKDHFYEIQDFVGERTNTSGTYIPQITTNHCESYFSDKPDEAIRILLRESELDGININHFLLIEVESVNAGPCFATCSRISRNGFTYREYDLCENHLACSVDANDEIDAVIQTLISKAEKEEAYWHGEQPIMHKFADCVTYGLATDNNVYVVFRESSGIDDSDHSFYRAMLSNKCFLLCDYDEFPEEDKLPFPYAYVSDYESYFSDTPTSTIKALLDEAKLADRTFTCFVMIDINENSDGTISAIRHFISASGTEVREFNIEKMDDGAELLCDVI